MKLEAKKRNRIYSYLCLALFAVSIVVAISVCAVLISNVQANRELIAVRDQLVDEIKKQETGGENEDCYTVYVKDDYTVTEGEGTIYIFKK